MAKKMSGNPAFKRSVEMMQSLLRQGGESKLAQKLNSSLDEKQKPLPGHEENNANNSFTDKMKGWKPLNV